MGYHAYHRRPSSLHEADFFPRPYTPPRPLSAVAAVAGIIIYATVNKNQTTFSVPDVMKPPTPTEVQTEIGKVTRLLRGSA